MTTAFFGPRWDAPVVDHADQVATPVGEPCALCDRPIVDGDQGTLGVHLDTDGPRAAPIHRGCLLGDTMGHYFGVCSCTGWDDLFERGEELVRRVDARTLRLAEGPADQ